MQNAASPFISYSIHHEDVLLNRVFGSRDSGFFVDVGAAHPVFENDTKALSDRGWTGINIEPNSAFYRDLVAQRPSDRNLNVAVSDKPGLITFHEVVGTGLSTCDPDEAKRAIDRGFEVVQYEVESLPLSQILEYSSPHQIDLLKIDVEGFELKVLASNDWERFRPGLIMAEATFPESPVRRPDHVTPFLEEQGYHRIYFDGLNDYYAERDFRVPEHAFDCPLNIFDNFVPYTQILLTQARDSLARDVETLTQERCRANAYAETLTQERCRANAHVEALTQERCRADACVEKLKEERSRADADVASLTSANAALRQSLDQLDRHNSLLAERVRALELDLGRGNREIVKLRHQITELISAETPEVSPPVVTPAELVRLKDEMAALRASTSWRITGPLRALKRPRRTLRILLGQAPGGMP